MKRILTALAGPPCSGKTATGKILAEIMKVDFLETDSLIEERSGRSIQQIFEISGEAEFRTMEKQTVDEILTGYRGKSAVIALGGGTLLNSLTRARVESDCMLFTLTASVETLLSRNTGGRPLSPDPGAFRDLLEARAGHYLSLPGQVDTEGRTPEETALFLAEMIRKEARSQ